jgi:hypothetical protein
MHAKHFTRDVGYGSIAAAHDDAVVPRHGLLYSLNVPAVPKTHGLWRLSNFAI